MNPIQNPYAPGAGQRPPELAGREPEIEAVGILMERLQSERQERGIMLSGLRGVGKTVLLEEFRSRAEEAGWLAAFVEAGSTRPFRLLAAQALTSALRATSLRHRSSEKLRRALGVFKAFSLKASPDGSVSLGIDIEPELGRADSGDLELDLSELLANLGEAARDFNAGVVLLIDELQELPLSDIAAVAGAAHHTNRRELPVALVGAGLPHLPAVLTEAKSYAERLFSYRSIGALRPADAGLALTRPAEALGVVWKSDALKHACDQADGYPYFLQAYGNTIWDYAPGPEAITLDDAEIGVSAAQAELDHGFYGSRWERATPTQRDYLAAMVSASGDDATTSSREVAERLGRTVRALAQQRDQLIRKGLIYAPERGVVAFTVPGMDAYIQRLDHTLTRPSGRRKDIDNVKGKRGLEL